MVSFYIVRHGQTLLNSLDRAQGWADSPLTNAGKQMAVELGYKLKGIDFNAAYTSDMLRAVQTAEFSHWNRNCNYEKNSRKACRGSPADFFVCSRAAGGFIAFDKCCKLPV